MDLNGDRGTLSLLKLLPPSRFTVDIMCAWAETRCDIWHKCNKIMKQYQNKKYPAEMGMKNFNGFEYFNLFRVNNNTLFVDWPWGHHRVRPLNTSCDLETCDDFHKKLVYIHTVVNTISDIGQSVFFLGEEIAYFPWNFPFPAFSMAPSFSSGNMPWPWPEAFYTAFKLHIAAQNVSDFSDRTFTKLSHNLRWDKRIPKAAFFASFRDVRHIACDFIASRPDLIDGKCMWNQEVKKPWNPSSTEEVTVSIPQSDPKTKIIGYLGNLADITNIATYKPGSYKYNVVISHRYSASGRLADLLAHSGSVILLAHSPFSYHFSARLKPWVHYVPLTYSCSDLAEKIEWLRANDHLARQIAINGRNFGKSYLRLEDYYCYIASTLKTLSNIMNQTDATEVHHYD